jgi:hypothetical protein
MGYDSHGLRQFVDQPDAGNLLKGIFIDDLDADGVDVPEISLIGQVSVYAGVDALIVSAGVEGGIRLTVGLNLHDSGAVPDGKLRFDEIKARLGNPICLFDVEGKLSAFLAAYVRVGFSIFSKTFRFELAEVTLLDFSVNPCPAEPPEPVLATVEGNNLLLNMGPRAEFRGAFYDPADPEADKDEQFVVRQISDIGAAQFDDTTPGTSFGVAAFGLYQEYTIPVGGHVIGDGGTGDDLISLQPGVDGSGRTIPFTVAGELRGGLDNDQLAGSGGDDQQYGVEG